MGYEPQHVVGPDGTAMVMLTAAAYEQLIDDLDDARDVVEGEKILARIAAPRLALAGLSDKIRP